MVAAVEITVRMVAGVVAKAETVDAVATVVVVRVDAAKAAVVGVPHREVLAVAEAPVVVEILKVERNLVVVAAVLQARHREVEAGNGEQRRHVYGLADEQ
jgi:hypothetical protein